jgi:N-acetyl-gamma-glutamylphosphate reductase
MPVQVAIVGSTRVAAALAKIVPATGFTLALWAERTTADHVEQAVGRDGMALVDVPAGESREFVRALGARNVRVVDLGPDLRIPSVPCGFPEAHARGKRVVALPSPAAMAALAAAGALLEKGLLYGDRTVIYAIGGAAGGLALENPAAGVAAEIGWMLEQRGAPPQRRLAIAVRAGPGMLAIVQGELGSEQAQDEKLLRSIVGGASPSWLRVCPENTYPDAAAVSGTGDAEMSVAVDMFGEWIVCSCAIDPVWFPAHAAVRAARAMSLE